MFTPSIHRKIFLFSLISLVVGMMFGTVPTSIPQFVLFGNWIFEGRFREKWQLIKRNKIFWVISSVFLLHVLGLIHTSEIARGIDDVRIKIPMLLLPLVFFTTSAITKKELILLLKFFVLAVVVSSLWCLFYYFMHDLNDARKASRFMSHIRLGLFINLCIGVLFYLFNEIEKSILKVAAVIMVLYLVAVMVVLGMITGLVLFGIVCFAIVIYFLYSSPLIYKIAGATLLFVLILFGLYFVNAEWSLFNYVDKTDKNSKKEKSFSGRSYFKVDTTNFHTENGFYISYNIQYDELGVEWHKRSKIDLYSTDKKGILVTWNVIRYLSSKGLSKDSLGVAQLSQEDISNIENGFTNYKYASASPLRLRLKEFFWEYKDYKQGFNPSGNTLLMRLEFWKVATYIIQRNLFIGVGTGDAQKAFDKSYYRTNTKLAHEWRLRSHNQFLAITVAFGFIGLFVFLFSILFPAIVLRRHLNVLYWLFLCILLVSFLTEDTLETQSGVSFFAYFNTLFLWLANSDYKMGKEN